jgi:octaprenyl-diphosphate synthase
LELNQIYQPVSTDLTRIETSLLSISSVDFPWLSQMLDHILKGSGKRIRPALTLLSGSFFKYNVDFLLPMAVAIELMHTATLVHDDAIDKSPVRRGRPTIYRMWGPDTAILLGDYLFAKAGVEVADTMSIRAIKLFSQTLMTISRGELNQAKNSFNLNQTRETYIQRIFGKTASLFCLATESGGILSEAPEEIVQSLREYGCNLGIAFQIVDDILDFIGTEEELGKPAGSDLAQGTLTLPAMLLAERYPENNPIKRLFEHRDEAEHIKKAIEQVRNSDIVDISNELAAEYCKKACLSLKILPRKAAYDSLIELADYVIKRKK